MPVLITNQELATWKVRAIKPSMWFTMPIKRLFCYSKKKKTIDLESTLQLCNRLCRTLMLFFACCSHAQNKLGDEKIKKRNLVCEPSVSNIISQTSTNFHQQPRKFKNCQHTHASSSNASLRILGGEKAVVTCLLGHATALHVSL